MSRILITGGAGFIGSYIARELVEKGEDVFLFDSFVRYSYPLDRNEFDYRRIRLSGLQDRVRIFRGDTRHLGVFRRAVLKCKPEIIVHTAALPIAAISDYHAEEAVDSTVKGTVNVLEVIRDVGFVKRLVYTSSSMVYGDFQYDPADEEHPKNPTGVYGGAKLAGEILTQAYSRRFGTQYTIIRPSAVYGPTDSNRRVSQIFVEKALRGVPLRLDGGGKDRLDFSYVKDVARGFVLAMFSPRAVNEVFNITRGEGRSLREFAQILSEMIPGVTMEIGPADEHRPKRGALDISKARELLGYNPEYSLEKGLEEYVAFVREHMMHERRGS